MVPAFHFTSLGACAYHGSHRHVLLTKLAGKITLQFLQSLAKVENCKVAKVFALGNDQPNEAGKMEESERRLL